MITVEASVMADLLADKARLDKLEKLLHKNYRIGEFLSMGVWIQNSKEVYSACGHTYEDSTRKIKELAVASKSASLRDMLDDINGKYDDSDWYKDED